MESGELFTSISVYSHHLKQNVCGTRAKYREGRKDTAVKVYTVNQESIYLLITNVPALGGAEELRALCDQYGIIDDFKPLDDYPCEEFTEVYLAKYKSFPSARLAKKHLDDHSFLGGLLHVCYAPEFETVSETRLKLQERRKYIAWKTKTGRQGQSSASQPMTNRNQNTKKIAGKQTGSGPCNNIEPVTYIWAGKEYTVFPQCTQNKEKMQDIVGQKLESPSGLFVPRQLKDKLTGEQNIININNTTNQATQSFSLPYVDDSSYLNTVSHVREKISNVSVPNVRVSLKRKRRL
ncbi:RNA-binding protein 48-like isoform X2 [Stegodyphus dumicola]|uniref:RNA-binding protein 48-like isoform X2 n=1 Tax=Stegodyphus dumicola TaxID=202533 RepID=UPI0015A7B2DE|nr:RNA-binding protein 48-like isoform X2 [Stegodyphus dumicola]